MAYIALVLLLLAWQKYWKCSITWSLFAKYSDYTNDRCGGHSA